MNARIEHMAGDRMGIIETRAAHSVREALGGEGRVLVENGISNRAKNIAVHVSKTFSADTVEQDQGRRALGQFFNSWGVASFEALGTFLSGDRKGVTPGRAAELEAMYWDVADAVAIGTVWGTGVNKDVGEAIVQKDTSKIDNLMGVKELVGIGRLVVDTSVTDPQLVKRLNLLRMQLDRGGNEDQAFRKTFEGVEQAYLEGKVPDEEAVMVLAYLTDVIADIDARTPPVVTNPTLPAGGGSEMDPSVAAYLQAMASYQERKGELEGYVEKMSLDELLDAYVCISAPRERAPQMWEYKVPEWMPGVSVKDWRSLLSFADGLLGGVYAKEKDTSEYGANIKAVKEKILGMHSVYEEDLAKWYSHPVLNLAGVMTAMMRDLMVPMTVTGKIGSKTVESRVYVFETEDVPGEAGKKRYKSTEVKRLASNAPAYKEELANRLAEAGVVPKIMVDGNEQPNYNAAKLAVALVSDIFEIGGVFSEADTLRKLSWESDAVRTIQRTVCKYGAKVAGGEMWGGPWTIYFRALARGDEKKAAEMAEKAGVIPTLLAGSFLDHVKDKKHKKTVTNPETGQAEEVGKSWSDIIYEGGRITLNEDKSDVYFGWRKDEIQAAADMVLYVTRKVPLEFKQYNEVDNVIVDWLGDLYNAIHTLRGNGVSVLPTSLIASAIGGSIGLWPFEGPYLRLNLIKDPKRMTNYYKVAREVISQLLLESAEEQQLLEYFGIDRKYFNDFGDKLTDYSIVLNPNSDEKTRGEMYTKGSLLRPRR